MAAPVCVGFIGCGRVTLARHLPALARVRGVEILAVCDPVPAAAEAAARASGARVLADAEALVAAVDVVAVCVPPALHAEATVQALAEGRTVFLEKPLALDAADGARIAGAAADRQLVLGLNLRHHRLVREARDLVERGTLGSVRSVVTRMTSTEKPREEARTAVLHDLGPHHFDLWRVLSGGEVRQVEARGHTDGAVVTGVGSEGARLEALLTHALVPVNDAVVTGEEATLRLSAYRFDGLEVLRGGKGRRLEALRRLPEGLRAARSGGVFAESYVAQWRHVVAVARGEAAPAVTAEDGLRLLEITLAAEASRTGAGAVAPVRIGCPR